MKKLALLPVMMCVSIIFAADQEDESSAAQYRNWLMVNQEPNAKIFYHVDGQTHYYCHLAGPDIFPVCFAQAKIVTDIFSQDWRNVRHGFIIMQDQHKKLEVTNLTCANVVFHTMAGKFARQRKKPAIKLLPGRNPQDEERAFLKVISTQCLNDPGKRDCDWLRSILKQLNGEIDDEVCVV